MKSRTRKTLILILGAIPIVVLAIGASFNSEGYCIGKMQVLPDNELVSMVLEEDLRNIALRKGIDLKGKWPAVLPEADFYATPRDIISQNPNCCRLSFSPEAGDDFIPYTTLMKVTGYARGYVIANYSRAYGKSPEQTQTLVTNCGEIYKFEDWFMPN